MLAFRRGDHTVAINTTAEPLPAPGAAIRVSDGGRRVARRRACSARRSGRRGLEPASRGVRAGQEEGLARTTPARGARAHSERGLASCWRRKQRGRQRRPRHQLVRLQRAGRLVRKAVADCNKKADGKYKINYVKLPTDANQQRELIVRRLAAKDKDIDLIGMDVIWTAELAEAGWILPWEGERRDAPRPRASSTGPVKTVEYKGKVYGIPFTRNTQLLWYRKDRVDTRPRTSPGTR